MTTEIDIDAEKRATATICFLESCGAPTEGLYQVAEKETYVGEDGDEKERDVTRNFCSNNCAVKYALSTKGQQLKKVCDEDV